MLSITPTVKNLLILNILFFVVDSYIFNLTNVFALRSVFSPAFLPFQFITYMFLHGSFGHLFSNMFGLFMFGPLLERGWGPKKFLFFYFFTGIGAGLLFSGIDYFENSQVRQAVEIFTQNPTPDGLVDFMSKHAERIYEANLDFLNKFEGNPKLFDIGVSRRFCCKEPIVDSLFLVEESNHSIKVKKESDMLLKMDLAKASDIEVGIF